MNNSNKYYKWELLIWLWLAYFFNQGDRQIFNIALPLIKADLGLTDAQLGLVGSIFILTLGLCFPFAGILGDVFNRKKIVGYSLLFWSAATFFTRVSKTYFGAFQRAFGTRAGICVGRILHFCLFAVFFSKRQSTKNSRVMKVTGIETYICHAYRTNWVFVKVLTDVDGLYGVGEATLEYKEHTIAQACVELERVLIGKDPHRIEEFWHTAYRDAYWRGGAVLMSALSAIEVESRN